MESIDNIAKKIATNIVVCKAYDEQHRWIWRTSDLTRSDKAEIKAKTAEVARILQSGGSWNEVLQELHKIATSGFHIGFKEQNRIIATCEKNGVKFADNELKQGGRSCVILPSDGCVR